jgi:regulator of sigma E protease
MEGLIMTAQILLSISILVGVHELGHLLAAKYFGMRVEQYSIGFPPKIFSFKWGETVYSLSAIPLGGFVKISGMIDESLDKSFQNSEPKPYEFRSKPAWQRLIVMLGGIIVNVIIGVFIFIMITWIVGDEFISKDHIKKHGIEALEIGESIGLQTGDIIVAVNGEDYESFRDLTGPDVILGENAAYTVMRGGKEITVSIPNDFADKLSDKAAARNFIFPRSPFTVGGVAEEGPAATAGLMEGDRITAIDGNAIQYYDEFIEYRNSDEDGKFLMTVDRAGEELLLDIQLNEDGLVGFYANTQIDLVTKKYSLIEAIPLGAFRAFNVVWINIKAFGKIFTGQLSAQKSLSGPIGIATLFGGQWDWFNFWRLTGMLSMVLAFINFLPIPALDGGHVAFLSWELISGRKPSDRFLEGAQKVGMVLLFSLMIFVIGNDILKLF